jgi:hypothetical protein
MAVVTSVIAMAVLILLYLFIKRRSSRENKRPDERRNTSSKPNSNFHAVSIKYSKNACAAAKDMSGRRFLSGAAPKIPLAGCDVLECNCKFVHHADRRTGDDRRNPYTPGFGGGSTGSFEAEQRKGRERRDEPPDDFFT